jgi:hypothetical protein
MNPWIKTIIAFSVFTAILYACFRFIVLILGDPTHPTITVGYIVISVIATVVICFIAVAFYNTMEDS